MSAPRHVYQIHIRASAELLLDLEVRLLGVSILHVRIHRCEIREHG